MNAIVVITFVIVALAAGYSLRPRPSWWFLRDRTLDQEFWHRLYAPDQMPVALSALQAISDAFLLRRDDIHRLRPEDKLHAIYRAAYPNDQTPDALEFELLSKKLMSQFHVPESVLEHHSDPSVQDVVHWCLRYSGA